MGVKISGIEQAIDTVENAPYQQGLKLMIDIDRRLVQITPRDTGRLANNWIASFNKPLDTSFPFSDDNKRPENLSPTGVYPPKKPRNIFDHVLYLTNNIIYAEVRNEKGGKGGQPPARWVERSVTAAVNFALRN